MTSPERIVSLLPSATETVCALGLRDRLVGVSHECDYPSDVIGLPVLTKPKLDPHEGSWAIDARVRAIVQEGLSIYRIQTELLQRLQPDLIVTQDQCAVCAVSLPEVEEAVRCFLTPGVRVVSLKPERLGDIWEDIRRVGAASGKATEAEDLLRGLKRRLWKLEQRTRRFARPRVACIEWIDPLIAGGHWIAELVEIAGGEYALASAGAHGPVISWETLVAHQPEVIIIMPCGFRIPQTQADVSLLTSHPRWSSLPAVQTGRVYIVDGNAYFNRPGPRIVDSVEILAELLHPHECAGMAPAGSYVQL
ncbi:MAG TPA: cobalamin-binding protein [Methylomirabilota bacterium]|jgi:iron complex transport system substrate-binding protein|nr:cobalamin-binding protein [Methylomirabilota bacterium]